MPTALDRALWSPPAGQPRGGRTEPWVRSGAVPPKRAAFIEPVLAHFPVAGSYSSAFGSGLPAVVSPPATRTSPSGSRVAVASCRAVFIEPVAFQTFVAG